MPEQPEVTLREFLEQKLSSLRDKVEDRILFENERFTTQKEELKLQADEYARRLADLNGEAARIAKSQAEHVPRGEYNIEVGAIKKRQDDFAEFKASHEGKASELQMMITFGVSILSLIIGAGALWVSLRH